ncbi:hypothetical protein [Legionella hackeliae]|uniref:Uncharacterized protein n=1 Tax=Legionella hackeliae TaxID=449 RepID=A0A0A8UMV3_LEGHA|nr:hypothetical protein [Legionella hackeliae]KTD08751.1 hypothetical protein Lhac_2974 [Legionella hackeliae]CEK10180.1 protein of unknown function [coiled-coil domain] [Legionella hackeliae]STX46904.1 Uncharacterised protein [Legionella hackeliae]
MHPEIFTQRIEDIRYQWNVVACTTFQHFLENVVTHYHPDKDLKKILDEWASFMVVAQKPFLLIDTLLPEHELDLPQTQYKAAFIEALRGYCQNAHDVAERKIEEKRKSVVEIERQLLLQDIERINSYGKPKSATTLVATAFDTKVTITEVQPHSIAPRNTQSKAQNIPPSAPHADLSAIPQTNRTSRHAPFKVTAPSSYPSSNMAPPQAQPIAQFVAQQSPVLVDSNRNDTTLESNITSPARFFKTSPPPALPESVGYHPLDPRDKNSWLSLYQNLAQDTYAENYFPSMN